MFQILEKKELAHHIVLFRIVAPRVAKKQQPGQFVIVRVHEQGERIPLTIAEADPVTGTISLVVQAVGKTTRLLCNLAVGEHIRDVVGPLGRPSEIQRYGTAVVIGGGVGTAIAYPTAKALKQAGNRVLSIVGARNKGLVILEHEIRAVSDEMFITTDDGSHGQQGLVIDRLKALIEAGTTIDLVLAIGPIPMMKAVAELTRPHHIKTVVSLNPIMVDGTGMCGGCRVLVNDESRFACVDGPEFDAHEVDFVMLTKRNAMYHQAERQSVAALHPHGDHHCKHSAT